MNTDDVNTRSQPITPSLRLTVFLSLVIAVLALFGEHGEASLQFDRALIHQGEWWRLLSGNLIHYGFYHLLMNLTALLLCGYVLLRHISPGIYLTLLVVCAGAVGGGLYTFNPEFSYYAGLSGVLHGLIMAGLLLSIRANPLINGLVLAAMMIKLLHEQWASSAIHHALLPVPVAVDAHLYGAAGGLIVVFLLYVGRTLVTHWQKN